jgi:hypothetical protein
MPPQHLTDLLDINLDVASYCAISLMAACNETILGGKGSSKAVFHSSQTFAQVNKRLGTDQALSDSTLAIIVMLIMQEQMRKEEHEAEIHYEGLKKMVELRGGLSQIESNRPLVVKICKSVYISLILSSYIPNFNVNPRTDITYSLQFGKPLYFFRDRMDEVRDMLKAKDLALDLQLAASKIRHRDLDPYLYGILLDITSFTYLVHNLPDGRRLDMDSFSEIVNSVVARLLRFGEKSNQKLLSKTEAVYQVGLTIFMMTIFLQYDARRIQRYDLVAQHFKTLLELGLSEVDPELVLWFVFMGGIWTSDDTDRTWLFSRAHAITNQLGISTWSEVLDFVKLFPWISAIHDQLAFTLWGLMT